MSRILFRGIMPALITPIDENRQVKKEAVQALMDYQYSKGVKGFYINGSTGEGPAIAAATRIADGIRQGKTEVAPVRMSGYCSCDLCDWRALCQQDPRMGGMPKALPSIRQDEVLEEILAERMSESEF